MRHTFALWMLLGAALLCAILVFCESAPAQGYNPYKDRDYRFGRSPPIFPRGYEGYQHYNPRSGWAPFPRSRPRYPNYIGRGAMWGYPYWQRRGWR